MRTNNRRTFSYTYKQQQNVVWFKAPDFIHVSIYRDREDCFHLVEFIYPRRAIAQPVLFMPSGLAHVLQEANILLEIETEYVIFTYCVNVSRAIIIVVQEKTGKQYITMSQK